MFEALTDLIPKVETDTSHGEWVIDKESTGSAGDPIHMPFVNYSNTSNELVRIVHECVLDNQEAISTDYMATLESYGINNETDLVALDISTYDITCTFTLILAVVRKDRFCEGILLEYLNNGKMLEWLKHLKKLGEIQP